MTADQNWAWAWGDFPVKECPDGWIELDSNGWNAYYVWLAGPAHACRMSGPDRHLLVLTTCFDAAGNLISQSWDRLTDEEIAETDDDTDESVAAAGIPPRPRGFTWYVRPPAQGIGTNAELFAAVDPVVWADLPATAGHPARWVPVMRQVVADMYAKGMKVLPSTDLGAQKIHKQLDQVGCIVV